MICEFYADSWSVGYIILFYFLILNSLSLSLVSTFPIQWTKNSPGNESVMETDIGLLDQNRFVDIFIET